MKSSDDTAAQPRPAFALAAAGIGLVLALVGVALLRRHPSEIDDVYNAGNGLGSHEASDFTLLGWGRDAAYVELIGLAGLVVACAIHAPRRRELVAAAGVALSFSTIFADSVARWTAVIAGRLYVGMCDDALISMRYARNLAEGRGLVYNTGEKVDGFTNPLWTFLMTIPQAFHLHEGIATVPITALGGILLLASALLAAASLARLGVPVALQIACAFAIMFDSSSFEFAATGLETPLLAFGTSLFVFGVIGKQRWPVVVAIVCLTLGRADGAIPAGLLVGWLVLEESRSTGDPLVVVAKRRWRVGALLLLVASGLVLWRLALYGHPAPNTAYLKVYPFRTRIPMGLASYGIRGAVLYGLPLLFVLTWARNEGLGQKARRLVLPFIGLWLYAMYIGSDAFHFMRFLGPVTPVLWMSVALAAAPGWTGRPALTNAFAFCILLLLVPARSEHGVLGLAWDHAGWLDQNLVAAKTIEQNVPPDSTVGTFYAGFAYYAPHHRFIDLLGKAEEHIAHQETIRGGIPGHNKFDFDYAYNVRKPDVTFTSLTCTEVEDFMKLSPAEQQARVQSESKHDWFFQAPSRQMVDPTFVALYAPHRVVLLENGRAAGHSLGCWFVREGAPVPIIWQVARQ